MPGLDKLRANRADAFAAASRAITDAERAQTLADTERADERVRDALTDALSITRVLDREGERNHAG